LQSRRIKITVEYLNGAGSTSCPFLTDMNEMNDMKLKIEKIPIWDHNDEVYLKAYHLDDDLKPAVLICPGGGYLCIAESESDPVAFRFAEAGYHPFVLNYSIMEQARYRSGETFKPVVELEKAFEILCCNAEDWHIDSRKIVLIGFSAGGHLAASYCSDRNAFLKPAALILSYPLIDYNYLNQNWSTEESECPIDLHRLALRKVFGTERPSEEMLNALDVKRHIIFEMPPTFIWHSKNDRVIDVESSVRLAQVLKDNGTPCKLWLSEDGIHGEPSYNLQWFDLALKWLKGIINEE